MTVYVDQEGCISCGLCVGTEPNVFRFNDEGRAEVYGPVTAENEDDVQRAMDSCPVSVIHKK